MSITSRYSVSNFGGSYGGLGGTVGFALYKTSDASVHTVRTTSNINELGTSTGVYLGRFSIEDGDDVLILWDTGGGTPVYAADEKFSQLNSIQADTYWIKYIYNTIRNQSNFETEVLGRLAHIKGLEFNPNQIKNVLTEVIGSNEFKGDIKQSHSLLQKMAEFQETMVRQGSIVDSRRTSFEKKIEEFFGSSSNSQIKKMDDIRNSLNEFNNIRNQFSEVNKYLKDVLDFSKINATTISKELESNKEFEKNKVSDFISKIESLNKEMVKNYGEYFDKTKTELLDKTPVKYDDIMINVQNKVMKRIKKLYSSVDKSNSDFERTFYDLFTNLMDIKSEIKSLNNNLLNLSKKNFYNSKIESLIPFLTMNKV